MADDVPAEPKITVPRVHERTMRLAIEHHEALKALDKAREIMNKANGLCKDCEAALATQIEREQAAVDALVEALGLKCPVCVAGYSRTPRSLNVCDMRAGCCTTCKAPIVFD